MEILIKRTDANAKLPEYGSAAGPGIDLYALNGVTLNPGQTTVVATGVAFAMPVGYIGLIRSQHSLMLHEPVKVTPDQVNSSCRGEISIELTNTGDAPVEIGAGDQIAQLLVLETHRAHLIEAEDLSGEAPAGE